MTSQDFRISVKLVWVLIIAEFAIVTLGALMKIMHWPLARPVMIIGIILGLTSWIIILSDMIRNKVYNKTFWLISMFIVPGIASLIYLIQRDKLVKFEKS